MPGAVAIVGMGCRFPGGADSPQRFWELLAVGTDATCEVPADRAEIAALYDPDPARPGRVYVRRGGYIDEIDRFDADFFGISRREARRMDPQQRLLLEVVWEALEDGCQPPHLLAGTAAGVFVGIAGHDYGDLQSRPDSRELIDVHVTAGSATSIAANRISYALDLRGPSLTVDTACSSALTAVHLACRSLADGECDVAIAAAVNALLTPEPTIGFCKAGMLAPDGRCKPFDAAADGYARGEGAGAVVLKPLQRARADGDPVHAVILATAINQDGRTPGISVPSVAGQKALLRSALGAAGLAAAEVQVVEAHGTGTPVGDPREAQAIGAVLGRRPGGARCVVGSVKGAIGHLEAAAGMAGLIKTVLALERRAVPPTVNFDRPNPAIDFEELALRVPTALEPWPAEAGARAIAGVNSFGFGGANAHAIVAEAPAQAQAQAGAGAAAVAGAPPADAPAGGAAAPAAPAGGPYLLPLSARHPRALAELAGATAGWLRAGGTDAQDACFTAALRRTHHEHRLAVTGDSAQQLAERLAAFAAGEVSAGVAAGRAPRDGAPRVAFVFAGMGPQWWGMGRELLREPAFAAVVERCDALLRPLADWSLLDELARPQQRSRVAEPYVAHVANMALQMGLVALLREWGVVPDAVVGHSSGEMGAACAAGALELQDAVALAFHRGRLQHRTVGSGGMLAAGIEAGEAEAILAGYEQRVSLAAVNGPRSLTLSGELGALGEIVARLEREGRFGRMLGVTVPYHGPQMDGLRAELLHALRDIAPRPPRIALVSTVTGDWQDGRPVDAAYWWRNVRRPVLFEAAVQRLVADGCDVFVELGPHPVLAPAVTECLECAGRGGTVLASLRRGDGERASLLRTLGELHILGRPVDWRGVQRGRGRCARMPGYPWQRERHWLPAPPAPAPQGADSGHPLLGRRVRAPLPAWEAPLGDPRLAFLEGHRVQERVTLPGAAHVELALAAARALGEGAALADVAFERVLGLEWPDAVTLGCVASERLEIHSSQRDAPEQWTRRASARIAAPPAGTRPLLDLAAIRMRCSEAVDPAELYATLRDRHGLGYSGAFAAVAELWRGDAEALARIALPDGTATDAFGVHPALLDAAFQALGALAVAGADGPLLPVAIARVEMYESPADSCVSHVKIARDDGAELEATVTLAAADGRVLLRCERLRLRRLAAPGRERWLLRERWEPAPRAAAPAATTGRVAAAARALLRDDGREMGLEEYAASVEPALNALALAHVRRALTELGARPQRAAHERHRRWLARLEALAGEAGSGPAPDPARLAAEHPAHAAAVELIEQSGRRLAGTLRGEQDAREWLVAGPSLRVLAELYTASPAFAPFGEALAEAVAVAVAGTAAGSARILEVGAGTGSATASILARLPAPAREYVFSDVTPFFLRSARERFGERRELRTAIVDVECPPAGEGGFDVVVAADVVHACADARAALANLRGMLAPGGLLLLMEAARRSAWLDLVFGQLDGWWRAQDREHPLIEPQRWVSLLGEAGFEGATAASDPAAEPAHAVIVARRAGERGGGRRRLVLTDAETGSELVAALRERGERCALVWPGKSFVRYGEDGFELRPGDDGDWAQLLREAGEIDAIACLWALDAPANGAHADALMASQRATCGAVVALTRAFAAAGRALPETWLVTAAAQDVGGGEDVALAQAPLWGVGRVLRTEQGGARCRMADIGAERSAADLDALAAELAAPPAGEDELAFRDGCRHARRLERAALPPLRAPATRRVAPRDAALHAAAASPGALESLGLRELEPRPPGPGEIEIEVRAAALNFRDVLVALGQGFAAAGEQLAGARLGWECAGVVLACGAGVRELAPGDEVVALAAGALGSRATTLAARAVRKPAALSFEQAATLPVAFLTAGWALERLARVQAGERVLVHCASGGVGLAAVQLARRAGAVVLATAGTPAKRAHLRALGIEQVMDSRTLDWVRELRGDGVDVVLNALAGEAAQRGLEILRPHGRFVEIAKRDIHEGGVLDLAPFRANLSYFALDLQPLYDERPALIGELLGEIVGGVQRGELAPLPFCAFDLADVESAFRLMAQARHIGKVVVTPGTRECDVAPAHGAPLLRGDGAYVITGGLGGFGLAVARWMARSGAGRIVLASRRGVPRDADGAALEELLAGPAEIHFVRADVTDARAAERLCAYVRESVAPLRGVVHAAMVLDDALLGSLDYARFADVLAPKLAGAWNMHEHTAQDELDLFVMFSSISLLIGQAAQSSYAAGNAFLGALAAHRRARGLTALTVDWGAIGGAGYVARQPGLEARLERQGLLAIAADDACELLGDLLRRDVTRIGVSRSDWTEQSGRGGTRPAVAGAGDGAARGLSTSLARAATEDRAGVVERWLLAVTARVLETAPERIDAEQPLPEMGVDSLMAVELRTVVRAELGVEVPIVDLVERFSVRGLSAFVVERLDG